MYKTIITSLLVAVLVLMGATSLSAQMVDSFPYFESWENGFGAWQQSQADIRGRVMMERQDNQVNGSYSKTVDVSDLANGVYMVEITSGELRAVRAD